MRQPPGRFDQLDRTGVGQLPLGGFEDAHVRQRPEGVGPHRHRNPLGAMGFDEHHVVDQQRATGVVPAVGCRLGEELTRGQVPVGRIGCGLEEFAQQHIRVHAGGGLGQVRRRRPVDGADGLRRRPVRHARAARQDHGQRADQRGQAAHHTTLSACSRCRAGRSLRSGATGFIGSGLVVTLCPRTSGRVIRKQAPLPGSPQASSRP